ncbi:hypothetical protein [Haloferax profundi]|uniref:Uncharacterized protein n=1 Tax=Haloferax profundi TaxID=1544718 RepID=A0A0W1SVP6_9EURY|nr:hypothetical protein [Haloferax profundi]KTG30535.1 hypothetical protein AUR66_07510 [Haloferax profundi]
MVPSTRHLRGITLVLSLSVALAAGFALFSPRPLEGTHLTAVFVLSVCLGVASLWMLAAETGGTA